MILVWINIISGLIILGIFVLITIFDRKNNKRTLKEIKLITLSGILVALAVTLNVVSNYLLVWIGPMNKFFALKFGNIVLVLTGFFCGGIFGLFSGIATQILETLIAGYSYPSLFFVLTAVLWSVLPYYLVMFFSWFYYRKGIFYYYLPIAYGFTLLLISGLNPIILKALYNVPGSWWVLYIPRLIKYPFSLVFNSLIIISCYNSMMRSLNLQHQFDFKNHFQKNAAQQLLATDPSINNEVITKE